MKGIHSEGMHKQWWDDDISAVCWKVFGSITPEEITNLINRSEKMVYGKKVKNTLIDLSNSPDMMSKETRAIFGERVKRFDWNKQAFVGTSSFNRILEGIIARMIGRENNKFFQTEEEARRWLKGN